MDGIVWMAGALGGVTVAPGEAVCYLCGTACVAGAPSQPTRTAIRDTFTDADLARWPEGVWVCAACAQPPIAGRHSLALSGGG